MPETLDEPYPYGHRPPTEDAVARRLATGATGPPVELVQLAERVHFLMLGSGSHGHRAAAELLAEALVKEREEAFKDGFEAGRAVGIAQAAGIIP